MLIEVSYVMTDAERSYSNDILTYSIASFFCKPDVMFVIVFDLGKSFQHRHLGRD
jgi:hypothetical protein